MIGARSVGPRGTNLPMLDCRVGGTGAASAEKPVCSEVWLDPGGVVAVEWVVVLGRLAREPLRRMKNPALLNDSEDVKRRRRRFVGVSPDGKATCPSLLRQ